MLEEGFDVTAFERKDYVGGLWHFTDDTNTTSTSECQSPRRPRTYQSFNTSLQPRHGTAAAKWSVEQPPTKKNGRT